MTTAEPTSALSTLEPIRIGEDEIQGVRGEDGRCWVVVKRVCDVLGLNYSAQHAKLRDPKDAPWATISVIKIVSEDQKLREVLCLHADSVAMWLARIDVERCAESVRPIVARFQKEAARVLADWSRGKSSAKPPPETFEQLMHRALSASSAKVEEQARQLAEAKPKVDFFDSFCDAAGLHGLQNAARILKQPSNKWIAWLQASGYLFRQDGSLVPVARYLDMGLFDVRVRVVDQKTYRQTFLTARGLQYFGARLPFQQIGGAQMALVPLRSAGGAP